MARSLLLAMLCLQNPSLKYQLPSEPNMYVDLFDDEDTQLMFEDWHDYSTTQKTASAKLHLFVDWVRQSSEPSTEAIQPGTGMQGSAESLERRSLESNSAGFSPSELLSKLTHAAQQAMLLPSLQSAFSVSIILHGQKGIDY